MAPTTRLRDHTIEQISYADAARDRTQQTQPRNPTDAMRPTRKQPERAARPTAKALEKKVALGPVPSGVSKQGAANTTPKGTVAKARKPAGRRECLICTDIKTSRGYQPPKDGEVCEHFLGICRACVQKLVKLKITDDDLGEPSLRCPFDDCGYEVAFSTVKEMVTVGTFESWDRGLLRRYLRDARDVIPCLNPKCGLRFSVENCNVNGAKGRQKLTCPYCDYEFCAWCDRAWHPETSCDQNAVKARAEEVKQSEKTMKEMGTQPCPHCGINIDKDGGCDHMFCTACKRDFYWSHGQEPGEQGTMRFTQPFRMTAISRVTR